MARRRMLSCDKINSDDFLELPKDAMGLYTVMIANCDDDGIVSYRKIKRFGRFKQSSVEALLESGFIALIDPEKYLVYITDWHSFNDLKADRSKPSPYRQTLLTCFPELENSLFKPKTERKCIQNVSTDKSRLDKSRLDKNRIEKSSSEDPPPQRPASLDEIRDYCQEYGINTDIERFFDFNEAHGWKIGDVNADWRDLLYLWIQHDKEKG